MKKIVAYIKGGIADVYPALTAIAALMIKERINREDVTIISDSLYYFRPNYHPMLGITATNLINKLAYNSIKVPWWIGRNFQMNIDDMSEELQQEHADEHIHEFMFWRPPELKKFVRSYLDEDTIFLDMPFTECFMRWDNKKKEYNRMELKRVPLRFMPSLVEKNFVDNLLKENHLVIHLRIKDGKEGSDNTNKNLKHYNEIIKYCNENNMSVIVIGIEQHKLEGNFIDLRGTNILSIDGLGYLSTQCKLMLGNDSVFSCMKLYNQKKDKLLICEHPNMSYRKRTWHFIPFPDTSKTNYILMDAVNDNTKKIKEIIREFYNEKR